MDYQDYYIEALTEPMRWFRMDSDWLRDFKIRKLMAKGGYAYAGMYVIWISCLAEADGHMYDMTQGGWDFLRADMSTGGCAVSESDLREFVAALVDLGLADTCMWEESGKLTSKRLLKEADENAKNVAQSRSRIDAMNRAKAEKKK